MNKHDEFTLPVIRRALLFIAHKYLDGDQFAHEVFTNPTSFTWMIFQLQLRAPSVLRTISCALLAIRKDGWLQDRKSVV